MARFFSTEVVQRLTQGSYERTIARLEEALHDANLFEGSDTHVLGTFNGYAIVASDEGEFARVKYEDLVSEVKILAHESLEVPSYADGEVSTFLKEESSRIIELWEKGHADEAAKRLRAIIDLSDSWPTQEEGEGVYNSWVRALEQDRPWAALMAEKRSDIEGALQEKINTYLRPKFRRLYDGSIRSEDLETYRSLVVENIDLLRQKAGVLKASMTSATQTLSELATRFNESNVVRALGSFSEDLLEDLSRIDTIASGSLTRVDQVDRLSRLHDLMASKINQAETASNFVDTMAKRLIGDSQEESENA